jgi:type II secretory pathway pseudopilin PulG
MNIIGMRAVKPYSGEPAPRELGYAMAGLLVAIAVMGLLLSLAMPTWENLIKREKEAELVFRGGQYARAITLYGEQFAGAFPPNIETLVEGRFLRKAYADPMLKDGEFELVTPSTLQDLPGFDATVEEDGVREELNRTPFSQAAREQNEDGGPVMGVRSRSTEASLMELNGLSNYADWIFTPSAAGLLGGHTQPQATVAGGSGTEQPGDVNAFGSGEAGAFNSGGGLGIAARGDNRSAPDGGGRLTSPSDSPFGSVDRR